MRQLGFPEIEISGAQHDEDRRCPEKSLNAAVMFCAHARIVANPMRNGESGIGRLTAIVFGTLLAAVVYTAYCVLPFFYDYFELQNQMSALVAVSESMDDAHLRRRLGGVIKEFDIPADPKDIVIDRRDHWISFSLAYDEVFYISFGDKDYDLYTFHFVAEGEGPF